MVEGWDLLEARVGWVLVLVGMGEVQDLEMFCLSARFGKSGRQGAIVSRAVALASAPATGYMWAASAPVVVVTAIAIATALGTAAKLLQETAAELVATPSLEPQQLATPRSAVVCEGLLDVEAPLMKTAAAPVQKQVAAVPPSESVEGPYSEAG